MPTTPLVYILLLNYAGANYTLACLDSLRFLDYPNYRVVVIDNASPDDSLIQLKARLESQPGSFHLIESADNLGFSGGNNLGIRWAMEQTIASEPAFIWLLNNDTTVEESTLSALITEAQKTGGVAGSLLLYPDGRYQQAGTRFNPWTGRGIGYAEDRIRDGMSVETLIGASMLIPLEAFRQVGLMDESFFLYFEDGELSFRLTRNGYPLTLSEQSKVYHEEGATTGRKSRRTQYYYHRNRLRLMMMITSPPQKLSILLYTLFRLLRSYLKSTMSQKPERKISTRIETLALQDFWNGTHGPCPHNLEALQ